MKECNVYSEVPEYPLEETGLIINTHACIHFKSHHSFLLMCGNFLLIATTVTTTTVGLRKGTNRMTSVLCTTCQFQTK